MWKQIEYFEKIHNDQGNFMLNMLERFRCVFSLFGTETVL